MIRVRILKWLKDYASNDRRSLMLFTRGGFAFAIGMMLIVLADQLFDSSIQQELIALTGLMAVIAGGIVSLWGYLGISLFKVLIELLDRDHDN
jgi:hypothetical protein